VTARPDAKTWTTERVLSGRFRAERLLGEVLGAETWLAEDLLSRDQVVVKASRDRLPEGLLKRLELEADGLRRLRDPLLTPWIHLGQEDDFRYLVRPFIPGRTLEERLRERRLTVPEALHLGRALFRALQAAHDLRILHRDITPSNVVIPDLPSASVPAVLVDIGLARSERLDPSTSRQELPLARYLSPEQAGVLDPSLDGRSDLYAAGLVFFESLAGRPPFQGEDVGELLRMHLSTPPPKLRSLGLTIPRALDEVIQRLLQKDPRDRYQSAGGVAADLDDILRAVEQDVAEPAVVVGLHDPRRSLTEPAFIGRAQEVAKVMTAIRQAGAGQGGLIVIEAPSGVGKTRLLEEVATHGRQAGMTVLRGQGKDQAAQVPFQVLQGVAAELVSAARKDAELAAGIRQRVGDRARAASTALPEVRELLVNGAAPASPGAITEERGLAALAALLDAMGTADRPALLLLDDCQWADEATVKLLSEWWSRRDPRQARYVLGVVAFRSEEVPPTHKLRALGPSERLQVEPLTAQDVRQLVQSMAGALGEEALASVVRLAEGNPFFAIAVLRGMVEIGALMDTPGGWKVDPDSLAQIQSSHEAAGLLARQLSRLTEPSLHLLSVGALLGKELSLELAAHLAGQTPEEAASSLQPVVQRRIIWMDESRSRAAFVHDKLRDILLARLSGEDKKRLHRAAAQRLEAQDRGQVFDLAYHYAEAGDLATALPYALSAGELARQRNALEVAQRYYEIAEQGAPAADTATRRRIAESLGDICLRRGRYEEAEAHLQAAISLSEEKLARVKLTGRMGELIMRRGKIERGGELYLQAARDLGMFIPAGSGSAAAALLWEGFVRVLHGLFPRLFVARRQLPVPEIELLPAQLYSGLFQSWSIQGKVIHLLWCHLRRLNYLDRYPPTGDQVLVLMLHAGLLCTVPRFRRALATAEVALERCKRLHDPDLEGNVLTLYAIVLCWAGKYQGAVDAFDKAIESLKRSGNQYLKNNVTFQLANTHYRLGNLATAVEILQEIMKRGRAMGDSQVCRFSLDPLTMAAPQSVRLEEIEAELAGAGGDAISKGHLFLAKGVWLLAHGRPREAVTAMQSAVDVVKQRRVRLDYFMGLSVWMAMALRQEWERYPSSEPRGRARLLLQAWKHARRGLRVARSFQNHLPFALREYGILAAMRGDARLAKKILNESLEVSERLGARLEHARSLLARGEVGRANGWPGAAADIASARSTLLSLGVKVTATGVLTSGEEAAVAPLTLSLVDRFATLLGSGRRIVSAITPEAALAAVGEAALQLLRGDSCIILTVAEPGEPPAVAARAGLADAAFDPALVEQALKTGYPATAAGDDSGSLPGARSALGAPFSARSRVAGVLYVSHSRVGNLFGEEEERLAMFLATLLGAALDNAEAVAKREEEAKLTAHAAELERSNAELAQFAYVASHDLSEPLRVVGSYVRLLASRYRGKLDADADEVIGYASDGVTRMHRLINDLLEYSRVGASGRPLVPIASEEILQRALRNLKTAVDEKSARVTWDPLPWVLGDDGQLERVFQNLLSNAIKFCDRDVPQVHVSAERQAAMWVFSVRDNGIGIQPQSLDRLFKLFQRLHDRSQYSGSGIGLAVCKKIVERHGGRIRVESAPGRGSTFSFTLPGPGPR